MWHCHTFCTRRHPPAGPWLGTFQPHIYTWRRYLHIYQAQEASLHIFELEVNIITEISKWYNRKHTNDSWISAQIPQIAGFLEMFLQYRYSNLTCIFTEAINLSSFGTFHNYWPYVIVEWFAIYIHIQIIHSMWMGILRLRDTFDCVRVCLWIMTATGIHTGLVQLWIYIMNTNVYKQKHSCIFVFTLVLRHSEVISNQKETSCLPLVKPGFEAVRLMHPFPSRLNAGSQTHWAIENQVKKNRIARSPWWASIRPTWRHCRDCFTPDSGDIHIKIPVFSIADI